jgi:hypothetical protein
LYKWAQDAQQKGDQAFRGSGRPTASIDEATMGQQQWGQVHLAEARSGSKTIVKTKPIPTPQPNLNSNSRRGSRRSYEKRGDGCALRRWISRFRLIERIDAVCADCVSRCRAMGDRSCEARRRSLIPFANGVVWGLQWGGGLDVVWSWFRC